MRIPGDSQYHKRMLFYLMAEPGEGPLKCTAGQFALGELQQRTPARSTTKFRVVSHYVALRTCYQIKFYKSLSQIIRDEPAW